MHQYQTTDAAEILAIGEHFGLAREASLAVRDNVPLESFRKFALANIGTPKQFINPNHSAGLVPVHQREESGLIQTVRHYVEKGGWSDADLARSESIQAAAGLSAKRGIILPTSALFTRTQTVNSAPAGGFTVETTLGPLEQSLRANSVVLQAGARRLTGLTGDLSIPKIDGDTVAYWLSETGEATESNLTFGQLGMTPKRLATYCDVSTQMLRQSPDIDAVVRRNLLETLGLAVDLAALEGDGIGGQPIGILNTSGINSTVTFGGAAEYDDVLEFVAGVEEDHALADGAAFIVTPRTKKKLKGKLKFTAGQSEPIWEKGDRLDGYPAFTSRQLTGDKMIFGDFSRLYWAEWGGIEVTVDQYTLKKSGKVRIYAELFCDFGIARPVAFNVSTDSAAQ